MLRVVTLSLNFPKAGFLSQILLFKCGFSDKSIVQQFPDSPKFMGVRPLIKRAAIPRFRVKFNPRSVPSDDHKRRLSEWRARTKFKEMGKRKGVVEPRRDCC